MDPDDSPLATVAVHWSPLELVNDPPPEYHVLTYPEAMPDWLPPISIQVPLVVSPHLAVAPAVVEVAESYPVWFPLEVTLLKEVLSVEVTPPNEVMTLVDPEVQVEAEVLVPPADVDPAPAYAVASPLPE